MLGFASLQKLPETVSSFLLSLFSLPLSLLPFSLPSFPFLLLVLPSFPYLSIHSTSMSSLSREQCPLMNQIPWALPREFTAWPWMDGWNQLTGLMCGTDIDGAVPFVCVFTQAVVTNCTPFFKSMCTWRSGERNEDGFRPAHCCPQKAALRAAICGGWWASSEYCVLYVIILSHI